MASSDNNVIQFPSNRNEENDDDDESVTDQVLQELYEKSFGHQKSYKKELVKPEPYNVFSEILWSWRAWRWKNSVKITGASKGHVRLVVYLSQNIESILTNYGSLNIVLSKEYLRDLQYRGLGFPGMPLVISYGKDKRNYIIPEHLVPSFVELARKITKAFNLAESHNDSA